ncbi:MAG: CCA tRNA nucleotidyltransferase [Holophagae bacterium]|nr:CCA tRNA nucleotidyltransferase [Holophagae bacterium]
MTAVGAARRLVASALLRRLAEVVESELFLVGGGLRDRLLGRPTHDLDLVVIGDPATAAQQIARTFGGNAFPLGKPPLVTWRVVIGRHQVDLSRAAGSLANDIWRRDFTVNALFWRLPRGPLIDLTGGLDDLAARRLRVVRAANLNDDPLRVLRAVRIMSTHPPLALTSEAERQVGAAAPGLAAVARERVVDELRRLLAGQGAGRALAVAARIGVLASLSPTWVGASSVAELARRATALAAMQRRGRGILAAGAAFVAPALLAAPAAGSPERWDHQGAAAALEHIG